MHSGKVVESDPVAAPQEHVVDQIVDEVTPAAIELAMVVNRQ